VVSLVVDGYNNVTVVFDRPVTTASGFDASFVFSGSGGTIVWFNAAGQAVVGGATGYPVGGDTWTWSPGGGLVTPDTAVVQSGPVLSTA
jgi:hypothetical protein